MDDRINNEVDGIIFIGKQLVKLIVFGVPSFFVLLYIIGQL